MTNGRAVDMWVRSTVCFFKGEGGWVIEHEHTSVPFDAESGRASVDLQP
jgi:ketosteroid isomerase-like protein